MTNKAALLCFLGLLLVASRGAMAQDQGNDGVYGYSSIEYDSNSGQIIGYSETDLDYNLTPYYTAYITAKIVDQNSNTIASVCCISGWSSAAVILTVPSSQVHSGQTYTIKGEHYALLRQTQYVGNQWCYIDYNDMIYFSYQYINAPGIYDFITPGPYQYELYPDIILGGTYDSASATVPAACGDQRDQIIKEYVTYNVAFHPTCQSFTQTASDQRYTFAQLNSGDYTWAVLQAALLTGLDNTVYYWSGGFTVPNLNSGYRNPAHQHNVDINAGIKYSHNSQHQFGLAGDLASTASNWLNIANAGVQAGACREPSRASTTGHVHLDWRAGVRNSCPPGW